MNEHGIRCLIRRMEEGKPQDACEDIIMGLIESGAIQPVEVLDGRVWPHKSTGLYIGVRPSFETMIFMNEELWVVTNPSALKTSRLHAKKGPACVAIPYGLFEEPQPKHPQLRGALTPNDLSVGRTIEETVAILEALSVGVHRARAARPTQTHPPMPNPD